MPAADRASAAVHAAAVYIDKSGDTDIDHDVEVVGWGEEHGVKYWMVSAAAAGGFCCVYRSTWRAALGEQALKQPVQ